MKITCEVCPHHLLKMCLGCHVKPTPSTFEDIDYLIQNIEHIDCLATDHAPHQTNDNPGIASTEFTASLYYTLVDMGILTIERMILMACINPRILLQIDDLEFSIPNHSYQLIGVNLDYYSKLQNIKITDFQYLHSNYIILDTQHKGTFPKKFKFSKGINSIYFGMEYTGKINSIKI